MNARAAIACTLVCALLYAAVAPASTANSCVKHEDCTEMQLCCGRACKTFDDTGRSCFQDEDCKVGVGQYECCSNRCGYTDPNDLVDAPEFPAPEPPSGLETPPQAEEAEEAKAEEIGDLKDNTRRLLSKARAKKPQHRGPRTRPEGAPEVKRHRNRTRVACDRAPCKGDIQYYNIKRHLEQCHDSAAVQDFLANKPARPGKKPVFECPQCGSTTQDFRRHFERHFPRGSKEFCDADAKKVKVAPRGD